MGGGGHGFGGAEDSGGQVLGGGVQYRLHPSPCAVGAGHVLMVPVPALGCPACWMCVVPAEKARPGCWRVGRRSLGCFYIRQAMSPKAVRATFV